MHWQPLLAGTADLSSESDWEIPVIRPKEQKCLMALILLPSHSPRPVLVRDSEASKPSSESSSCQDALREESSWSENYM